MADVIKWLFSFPRTVDEVPFHAAIWAFIFAMVLVVVVHATGQTFGQRCAVAYEKGTDDWRACVHRLSQGGSIDG